MQVDKHTGLLDEALFLPSPHCEPREDTNDIDLIVLHGISLPAGEFGGVAIDALFLGTLNTQGHPSYADLVDVKVSAHLLIRRDGTLTQYVPFHQQAWHAGESTYDGRDCCNQYSIGIELEGTDTVPYESVQYQTLLEVISVLQACYPKITKDRIKGHEHIASGRKTDPGPAFDWDYLHQSLRSNS